jgi:hypothetical protein
MYNPVAQIQPPHASRSGGGGTYKLFEIFVGSFGLGVIPMTDGGIVIPVTRSWSNFANNKGHPDRLSTLLMFLHEDIASTGRHG